MALPIGAATSRWRNRKTRKSLAEGTRSQLPSHVSPETAHQLSEFIETPDFETIALSVATQIFASAGTKNEKRELDATREQLKQLIRLHITEPDNDDLIANSVWESLKQKTLESIEKVRTSETLSADTRASLVRIASCFTAADLKIAGQLCDMRDLSGYLKFENQLADQIKNVHATMALPHAGTTRKVPYSKLFVEPSLRPLKVDEGNEEPTYDLSEVIGSSHRTVILGDPGGGKSTLSLKLAYDIARKSFSASSVRIPLLFILRDHIDDFRAKKATMGSFLEDLCRKPYNIEPPCGAIEYLLSSGRALVIFDGLDELTDTSLRRQVVQFVESFVYRYPATPVLVTSRRVGYSEAPLDENLFTAVSLADLDEPKVKFYAEKWFALDESVDRRRRTELALSFIRESQFVADLRKNPLMLSLMCGIYASENYIPSNRPDVYKKCAELLFERWDKQRGILIPLPFDAHVRQALNALALEMYSDPAAQHGLTRDRLVTFMTSFLSSKRFEDEAEAEDAANQFVEFCTGRAWVLTDMGSNVHQSLYGFTHRTFLEYFAGNQLVRTNSTPESLFDKLHERILASEWEVVSQLALQILGQNVEDGGDKFLDLVLDAIQDTRNIRAKINLISFAARSLSFMVPRPELIERICQDSVDWSIAARGGGEGPPVESSRSYEAIGLILQCSPENTPLASKYLKKALLSNVSRHPDNGDSLFLALFFESLHQEPHKNTQIIWENVQKELIGELLPNLASHRRSVWWAARLSAVVQGWPMSEVLSCFEMKNIYDFTSRIRIAFSNPFVMDASFNPNFIQGGLRTFFPMYDAGISRCLAELAVLLPEAPTPWIPAEFVPYGFGSAVLTMCDGQLSEREGLEKEGAILLLLPASELNARDPEGEIFNHGPITRVTGGKMSNVLRKWAHSRLDPESRPSALATLRGLKLSESTTNFIVKWINCEVCTVEPKSSVVNEGAGVDQE